MNMLYINDIIFQESSGELYHTRGFLKNLGQKINTQFVTFEPNRQHFQGLSDIAFSFIMVYNIKLFNKIHYYYKCMQLFKKNSFNVIYIRESFFIFLFFIFFLKDKSVQYVLEINGISEMEVTGLKKLLIVAFKILLKPFYSMFNHIFVVSGGIKQYLSDKYKYRNMRVLENGSIPGKDLAEVNRENSIVFAGGLSYWQNFNYLIHCINKYKQYLRDTNYTFLIFGAGIKENDIKESIKRFELEDILLLKGVINNSELHKKYRKVKYGLLIDDRIYKGSLLFSPLKYYEYKANKMITLYFSDKEINLDRQDDIFIINEHNLIKIFDKIRNLKIDIKPRTWNEVVCEVLNNIK